MFHIPGEGDPHAVQDHRPRTPATANGACTSTYGSRGRCCRRWRRYASELKASHEAWKETLSQAKPGSDPIQIASEALEMAIQELENRLHHASPADESEPLSLDEAMAYVRKSFVARVTASRQQRGSLTSPPNPANRRAFRLTTIDPFDGSAPPTPVESIPPPTATSPKTPHQSPSPAAKRAKHTTSSPPSARSRPSSRPNAWRLPKKNRRLPASRASVPSPFRSFPTR